MIVVNSVEDRHQAQLMAELEQAPNHNEQE